MLCPQLHSSKSRCRMGLLLVCLAFQWVELFSQYSCSPDLFRRRVFFLYIYIYIHTSDLGAEFIQVAEAFPPLLTNNFQVSLGRREMVSLSRSTTHRFRITADAAALTFSKQNGTVLTFARRC